MRKFNVAIILMAGLLLTGCTQPHVVPKDHYYRLRVPAPAKVQAQPKLDGIIEIDRFSADGLVAGRSIVYSASDKPNQLMDYNYHFWTEPPTVLLRDQLIEYLRAAGVAKTVVTAELRVAPDFIISGKIKRFEQVRDASPHVVLEMELGLRQAGTDNLVYWGTYAKKVVAEGTTVADGVKAANSALAQVYSDYVRDLLK